MLKVLNDILEELKRINKKLQAIESSLEQQGSLPSSDILLEKTNRGYLNNLKREFDKDQPHNHSNLISDDFRNVYLSADK